MDLGTRKESVRGSRPSFNLVLDILVLIATRAQIFIHAYVVACSPVFQLNYTYKTVQNEQKESFTVYWNIIIFL